MYKNLYVNGCSFTRGHTLEEQETWPYILSKELNLKLTQKAANSNSMETICDTTIMDLTNYLSPKTVNNGENTLVIIGLTWPGRQALYFDNTLFNITAIDEKEYKDIEIHKNAYHRIGGRKSYSIEPSVSIDEIREKLLYLEQAEAKDPLAYCIDSYFNYLNAWIKYDDYWYKNNIKKYILSIIKLESFLKANNFNYLFVRFQPHKYLNEVKELWDKVDKSKVIAFRDEKTDKDRISETVLTFYKSHPDVESCIKISKDIANKIKNDYYE